MIEGKLFKKRDLVLEVDVCQPDSGYVNLEIDYKHKTEDWTGEFIINVSLDDIRDTLITKKTMDFDEGEYYIDSLTYEETLLVNTIVRLVYKLYSSKGGEKE